MMRLEASGNIRIEPLNARADVHRAALVDIWNHACGPDLHISAELVTHNLASRSGLHQEGRLVWQHDRPMAAVIASCLPKDAATSLPHRGWIDALVVMPASQRQGVGRQLLTWAEDWLATNGCREIGLGGSLYPFAPGCPVELDSALFFVRHGYRGDPTWDVVANLAGYQPPPDLAEIDGVVRPARPGEEESVRTFLQREFPGRWCYKFEQFVLDNGRISDFMLLWTEAGLDGFCQLTFEDSRQGMDRFYPYRLARPWGQLGPIGVSERIRGRGYGSALLDAGLRRLHNNGVNGCVIDWTDLLDFYAKFGFMPYREYVRLRKTLPPSA